MSAGAHVLTTYLTFVSRRRTWRLYRGVGGGELLAEVTEAAQILDVAAADRPILWLCSAGADGAGVLQRVRLPQLVPEAIEWRGGRIGAVATVAEGDRAAVLELPGDVGAEPQVRVWSSSGWTSLATHERPDISSALAWLDRERIVFESAARRLTVVDVTSGQAVTGPPGSSPTVAWRRREWFAVSGSDVLSFPIDRPFETPPGRVEGFDYGSPSRIRLTSDGEVCTWTEPRLVKQVKGYVQVRGKRRRRLRELDDGLAAVVGPVAEAVA